MRINVWEAFSSDGKLKHNIGQNGQIGNVGQMDCSSQMGRLVKRVGLVRGAAKSYG